MSGNESRPNAIVIVDTRNMSAPLDCIEIDLETGNFMGAKIVSLDGKYNSKSSPHFALIWVQISSWSRVLAPRSSRNSSLAVNSAGG